MTGPASGEGGTIGQAVRDADWERRTAGAGRYFADIALPGMLFARFARSDRPHARIRRIDTRRAAGLPGVVAVLTAGDMPDDVVHEHNAEAADRYPLARDVVRYVGEEVAIVAAGTRAQAATAAGAVEISYRRLPTVLTLAASARARVPLHERAHGGTTAAALHYRFGSVPEARRRAVAVERATYRFARQAHASMETGGMLARWDRAAGLLDVWTPTQVPHLVRAELARILRLAPGQVRLQEVAVGGGFGTRSKPCSYEVAIAVLAMRVGRPVSLAFDRHEEFAATRTRHAFEIDLETGLDAEGGITHRRAGVLADNGAYNHAGPSVIAAAARAMAATYRTGAIEVRARLLDTNKVPGGPFRGYGVTQATFAMESQLDELAERAGIDPVDVRLRNAHAAGEETHTGWRLASAALRECLEAARDGIGWDAKRRQGGRGRGVGLAAATHVSGAHAFDGAQRSAATVEVLPDGGVRLWFGGADPGTGQRTMLGQIVATELGVGVDDVEVRMMSTAETPYDAGTWSSRGTVMGGNAARSAAARARQRLSETATEAFGADAAGLRFESGTVAGDGFRAGLGKLAVMAGGASGLRVEGVYEAPTVGVDHDTGYGNISAAYAFAVHAAEVEVDLGTGQVRVLRVVAAHDCGTPINRTAVEGQIVGGVVMGLGAALGEELVDEGGRTVNPAYVDYPLMRAADAPAIRPVLVGSHDPNGPYGAKSVAEVSIDPTAAAVANAVAHATGVRIRDLPLTPDRVLEAVRAADGRPDLPRHWVRHPSRWWIAAMRWAYPRGLHGLLHRWGTRLARPRPPARTPDLRRPASLAEARRWLAERPEAVPLGGGTDLLPARDAGVAPYADLVDVAGVPELSHIERAAGGDLRIGAAVRLEDLAGSDLAGAALRATVRTIASPQVRRMATVAGNLCQQKRCAFYRNGFSCYKRGGVTCPCYAVTGEHRFYHAVAGAHRCQAVTPSDLATTLVALDASCRANRGGDGGGRGRWLPVARLYAGPGEVALAPGELLEEVRVPAAALARRSAFEKLRRWEGDFAVVSACASVALGPGGVVEDVRAVLGAVAPTPYRARRVEQALLGTGLTPERIAAAARLWQRDAHPLPGNGWKVFAATAMLERALRGCLDGEG